MTGPGMKGLLYYSSVQHSKSWRLISSSRLSMDTRLPPGPSASLSTSCEKMVDAEQCMADTQMLQLSMQPPPPPIIEEVCMGHVHAHGSCCMCYMHGIASGTREVSLFCFHLRFLTAYD